MTILSVNKTRGSMGAVRPFFSSERNLSMKYNARYLTRAALIAALYTSLCYLQNALIPGSANWAIQFRAAEAMCVLAFFTPAAIPGLTIGCFAYNVSFAGALPLDFLVGSAATFLSVAALRFTQKWRIGNYPLLSMLMPAIFNGVFIGWELSVYVGGGFFINCLYVFIGEAAVLLSLGTALYYAIKGRKLAQLL